VATQCVGRVRRTGKCFGEHGLKRAVTRQKINRLRLVGLGRVPAANPTYPATQRRQAGLKRRLAPHLSPREPATPRCAQAIGAGQAGAYRSWWTTAATASVRKLVAAILR